MSNSLEVLNCTFIKLFSGQDKHREMSQYKTFLSHNVQIQGGWRSQDANPFLNYPQTLKRGYRGKHCGHVDECASVRVEQLPGPILSLKS